MSFFLIESNNLKRKPMISSLKKRKNKELSERANRLAEEVDRKFAELKKEIIATKRGRLWVFGKREVKRV